MTDPALRSQLAALGVYREAVSYAGLMCPFPNSAEQTAAKAIVAAAEAQDAVALRAAMQSAINQNLSTPLWRLWVQDLVAYLDTEAIADTA